MKDKKNQDFQKMPFALKSIQIKHFQGITNLKIDNIPLDVQWIFLTGENSFGKTSLLRAIARVLAGDEEYNLPKESMIVAEGSFKNRLVKYQAIPKELNPHDVPLATYGTTRFLLNGIHQQVENKKKHIHYCNYPAAFFRASGLMILRVLMPIYETDLLKTEQN
jgi:recombinational DNA repair ATPase RecF